MPTSPAPAHEQTLKNLLAAFNGESNASARYAAFAVKADEDGYLKVASLFRAASRAEQIHAANHAKVIVKMGAAAPVATIEAVTVNTTVENLKAAIAGETYEVDVMYPDFIKEAEAAEEHGRPAHFQLRARGGKRARGALYKGAGTYPALRG